MRILQWHIAALLVLFTVQITSLHHHILLSRKVSILRRSQQSDIGNAHIQNESFLERALKKIEIDSNAVGVIIGTVSTIFLIKNTPFQLIASPIVGLLAAVVCPSIAAPAYCGSFIGAIVTKSSDFKTSLVPLLAISIIAACQLTFFDCYRILSGIGGRLGFIAFTSGIVYQLPHFLTLLGQNGSKFKNIPRDWCGFVVATMTGATACSLLRTKSKLSPVLASGFVGLVAQALASYHVSMRAAAKMIWCGSFVAMSTPILTVPELLSSSVISTFAAFILQSIGWNVGGQLGAAALIGVIVVKKTISLTTSIISWKKTHV